MDKIEAWDKVLQGTEKSLKTQGSLLPTLCFPKKNELLVAVFAGMKNSSQLLISIKAILNKEKPDFYIFQTTGWATTPKIWEKYGSAKRAPLDDKTEVLMQILVDRKKGMERNAS